MVRSSLCFSLALLAFILTAGGCASNYVDIDHRPKELRGESIDAVVPQSAGLLRTGIKKLTAESPADGQVYLFDTNDEKLVYTAHVDRGQRMIVDTAHDWMVVEGEVVCQTHMFRRHVYQIYLDPGATGPVMPAVQSAQATGGGI